MVGNARFLILPQGRVHNLASHILARAAHRLAADWQAAYGYAPVLVGPFVETGRFTVASYRAAELDPCRADQRTRQARPPQPPLHPRQRHLPLPAGRDYRCILTAPA